MPELDDQLRAVARRIDADSTPVDLDELLSAGPALVFDGGDADSGERSHRPRLPYSSRRPGSRACSSRGTTIVRRRYASRCRPRARRRRRRRPVGSPASSATPPGDLYSLAQPASITLPGGNAIPIVPGNPITQSGAVTLDSDGSTYPGQAGPAASLLWGAANPGGPFAPTRVRRDR